MKEVFRVAPFGTVAWVWTVGFIAGFLFFAGKSLLALSEGSGLEQYDVLASVLLLVLIAYSWVRSVRAYEVEDNAVVVQRAGPGRVHISYENMEDIEVTPNLGSFFNRGLLSLGGLFGWAGPARYRHTTDIDYKEATIYGTNPSKAVTLQMKDGRAIVLTPADPEGFASAVRPYLPNIYISQTPKRNKKRRK